MQRWRLSSAIAREPKRWNGLGSRTPETSAAAVERLEKLRAEGARFLVFPRTMFSWLERHDDFKRYVERRYGAAFTDTYDYVVYSLAEPKAANGSH